MNYVGAQYNFDILALFDVCSSEAGVVCGAYVVVVLGLHMDLAYLDRLMMYREVRHC